MRRRELLTDAERHALFGLPDTPDGLARHYTLDTLDRALIDTRRTPANRLGFAAVLAMLRHPGITPALLWPPAEPLLDFLAAQLGIPAAAFDDYARRPQMVSDYTLALADRLGLRMPTRSDIAPMIAAASDAAWQTDRGLPIVAGVVDALHRARVILPAVDTLERAGLAGRARARARAAAALLAGLDADRLATLDALTVPEPRTGRAPLTWIKDVPVAPRPDHVREILAKLAFVRDLKLDPATAGRLHPDRLALLVREGRVTPAHAIERYTASRRRAILVATVLDLEQRLTDAALLMADRLIADSFARAKNARERRYSASGKDVARLMGLLHGTAAAVDAVLKEGGSLEDVGAAIADRVGLERLAGAAPEAAAIASLADEDPLLRAADKWLTLRKYGPQLLDAIDFRASRADDRTVAAIEALRQHHRSGKRELPKSMPMPFRKEWRKLVVDEDGRIDPRMYETALFAHARNRWRSGEMWVERSGSYRRFDSYLLPIADALPVTDALGLPRDPDAWIEGKAAMLDWRLRRLTSGLQRGRLDGVVLKNGKLSLASVRSDKPAEAENMAARLNALLPRVRITELLHEVARATGFLAEFTNFRTGRAAENESALLAAILADATNLGLSRMADASQGLTREQLFWTRDAHVREETYRAALARIIDAHHRLPLAALWGDGTTSASDGQFFRSGKRGDAAGAVNARYGVEPGYCFYAHTSNRFGTYAKTSMSSTEHEALYVLDGLKGHGSTLRIAEHYTDTGGATDIVHFLCEAGGIRFCPRLRDFADRRLATIEPASRYPALKPLLGNRVKLDVIRELWDDILRLVASIEVGHVRPSAMLKKLAAFERQNRLDLALKEAGRLVRTEFMIDWMEMPELRRRCHAGLNKSEQRHALAGQVYTWKQGRIADRDADARQFRASGLNLVIAAIVHWNTTYLADAIAHLHASGETVPEELLRHSSPISWEHIAFSGDFLWERAAVPLEGRRPLNIARLQQAA